MKIECGPYEVLQSGTVISFGTLPTKFHLADDFILSFVFKYDSESPNPSMTSNPINDSEGEVVLTNFTNTLGEGTLAPVSMGTIGNREVLLNFRVYSLGKENNNKTIHYTFYLGGEIANGN